MAASSLKKYAGQYSLGNWEWSRWSPLMARVTAVLLVLLIMWQLVQLVLLWLSGPEVAVDAPIVQPQPVSQSTGQLDIANWHLFGRSVANNPLNLSALPETPLDLELRGIVSGIDSDQSGHAIIVDRNGGQWVYAVGDDVPGGATVQAITPQQVVLRRNGQDETLSLPELLDGSSDAVASSGRPPGARQGVLVNAAPSQLRGLRRQPGAIPSTSVPIAGLGGVQLGGANLQQLTQSVQVTPVSGGFKVFPGRNAEVFRQLGLHANDVITAVNGQPMTNAQAALQLFQNLDKTQAITLSVRRGNQVLQLQPDLSALK